MSKKEPKIVPYQCEKLNQNVMLVLKYNNITEDHKVLVAFDCKNSSDCGVAIPKQNGGWTFDWDSCPAYNQTQSK